jgi:hypothetical protein
LKTLKIFTGFDKREAVGWHVFCQSVIERCSIPVEITPLSESFGLAAGGQRDGTNAFTYARFLVPEICGFVGHALYVDGADMLVRSDIAELWDLADRTHAVQVVQHSYQSKHDEKYVGTSMQSQNRSYPRKNWSSLMLWNCGHPANHDLRHEFVRSQKGKSLHAFSWLEQEQEKRKSQYPNRHLIGSLPMEWNWLVGEYDFNPGAKLVHFTLGIPGFTHYSGCDYASEWNAVLGRCSQGLQQLKGTKNAIHA